MSRTRTLSLSTLIVISAILTGCGANAPSAQINASSVPAGGETVNYPKQNLKFTAKSSGKLPLRIHVFDQFCQSSRASLKVKSIQDPVAAKDLKVAKVKKLKWTHYDMLKTKDGASVCEKAEGNLDVQLVPGHYVLVIDSSDVPVNITVLPHKS